VDDVLPSKGSATRGRILSRALELASQLGLEGLTIGELATDLGMSKSGLFAHFRSKERLQLAVLELAAEGFTSRVFRPALKRPRGEPRLRAIFENWLAWVSSDRQGGCIFLAGAMEYDDRGGPLLSRTRHCIALCRQCTGRRVPIGPCSSKWMFPEAGTSAPESG
jgi:AcrR family transcriptional regulator